MASTEANPKPFNFPFAAPRVELSDAYLRHAWGEHLDKLHLTEHDDTEIEADTLRAKGFILDLTVGKQITDVQRDLMYDLLSKAREGAVRRVRRRPKG